MESVPELVARAVAEEREACATLSNRYEKEWDGRASELEVGSPREQYFAGKATAALQIADAIRNRPVKSIFDYAPKH
jgi:hypothetical protein